MKRPIIGDIKPEDGKGADLDRRIWIHSDSQDKYIDHI